MSTLLGTNKNLTLGSWENHRLKSALARDMLPPWREMFFFNTAFLLLAGRANCLGGLGKLGYLGRGFDGVEKMDLVIFSKFIPTRPTDRFVYIHYSAFTRNNHISLTYTFFLCFYCEALTSSSSGNADIVAQANKNPKKTFEEPEGETLVW